MASAQNEPDEEHDLKELRIVLLGVSGAGKSPTANAILGRDAFEESRTRESEIQRGRVEDRNISIIDTPGFFNTQLTDEELRKQMMRSLDLSHPGPHVFLLVINLETFRDEQRNIVEQIQENFGEEALLFTMVLFVRREKIAKREFNQIIESEETQKILNYFEGRFHVINSKTECETSQITRLFRSIDDMLENNGGKNYNNEIYLKSVRKLREEERIKQEEDRMKQEQVRKRQEESDAGKQKEAMNQEEEIKTRSKEDEWKQDDVKKKKRAQYPREKVTTVQEDLRKQLGSQREKERQRWENERAPSRQDLRIVILGKSDAGKTATANTILDGKAEALASTLNCKKQEVVVSGRTISIIDTPALFDALWYKHLKGERERDIEECLTMSAPGPHVFLLVIKLNGKYTEDEKNTMKWLHENFGDDAVRHTIVLFTHADLLKGESLDQYMRKSPDLQSLIDSCDGRFHSFNNQDKDNQSQVTELLEKIKQLVKDNRGQHHNNENSRKAQKKQEQMGQEQSEDATESDLHDLHSELLTLMVGLEMSEMAMRLSLARAVAQSRLSRQGLRIVLLGFLGAGKSSTGNTILGRNVFTAGLMTSTMTCEIQSAMVAGRTISIIDTPGILDPLTFRHTEDHKESDVEKCLEMSAPGPHAFLLVIGMEGLAMAEKNPVKWFQENLEKDALNHTIVLITYAGFLNVLIEEPLNEYIKKNRHLKSLIDSCGGRYHLLDNRDRNNEGQVTELLEKIDEIVQRNEERHYTKQNIFKRKDADGCEIQ